MTIKECIKKYAKQLQHVTHIPNKEVEILMLHLLDKNVIWLHLHANEEFAKEKELAKLVEKRATDYPMEYITNRASFYGESFIVKTNVLIPRPETEILVDNAVEILKDMNNPKIIEVGVGSGIISVMLAKLLPSATIIGVDINDDALSLASLNAQKHGVENQITFMKSDLLEEIQQSDFDMCISNPPYIANNYKLPKNVQYEPSNALFGGEVGVELLKRLIKQVDEKNIKYLLCEFGYDQKELIGNYFKNYDMSRVEFYKDYENFDRGFTAVFK